MIMATVSGATFGGQLSRQLEVLIKTGLHVLEKLWVFTFTPPFVDVFCEKRPYQGGAISMTTFWANASGCHGLGEIREGLTRLSGYRVFWT